MIEIELNEKNLLLFLKNIRQEDKKELEYFFKENLEQNFIKICLKNPETYFVADKNLQPIAIGGVKEIKNNNHTFGQVWLLCTNEYKKNKISLYKYIKSKIDNFKTRFDFLFNYIYKTNFDALLWLKKCGFVSCDCSEQFKLFYYTKGVHNFDL